MLLHLCVWCPFLTDWNTYKPKLLCSRPTAVNLSDAAQKLGRLAVNKAAETGSNAQSVTDAVIAACKEMLADDIAANQVPQEYRQSCSI